MSASYSNEKCIPCMIDTPVLDGELLLEFFSELDEAWRLIEDIQIEKTFKFKDFKTALDFVNKIGEIAESNGHHPDIELGWGRVKVSLMTHKIHGLSRNDFIVAAQIDEI
ncbi:4a-hydroxytetrahydrobiopterin dehydratase [Fusibacter bizertensis]|uniref:4a-hydroxytetrahydrobiopterin dehydratase n=1 Tax=Fusibacter bizertensis TaxID=1488331 RepID=A0ABT6NF43_9FIRM|nr:4a-hydroxytetrahydrobiopterin dehydratase [Fusibacter bizertensis]MDH8678985.1 4a-hydroxytetrahydrobiopterin dehydratase [Fusibacter bizertensis]